MAKKKSQRYIHAQHHQPPRLSIRVSRKNDRSDSTPFFGLPNRRPDPHDVDYFFRLYQKWWRGAEIWLVLTLGKGATLELKNKHPLRLTLTNENILAALMAWDIIMGGQSAAPRVRLLYPKLQRFQHHFFSYFQRRIYDFC
jgi:hypothetical protein